MAASEGRRKQGHITVNSGTASLPNTLIIVIMHLSTPLQDGFSHLEISALFQWTKSNRLGTATETRNQKGKKIFLIHFIKTFNEARANTFRAFTASENPDSMPGILARGSTCTCAQIVAGSLSDHLGIASSG
jgi:hypothetical protein